MTSLPLVSIICLCYNHEKFLEEALISAINQEYPNKEIIVIDDCSIDHSPIKIKELIAAHPDILFIQNKNNMGNCSAFNLGFQLSKGDFIIDFATDDVMLPGKIQKQVEKFMTLPETYGVVYSDAEVIDEMGMLLGYHHKGTKKEYFHPEGDVFKSVLQKYFICPPTMMIRRKVLESTGGYDATLAYEDFNFWVETSRKYQYAFMKEALIKRRVVKKSFSLAFYTKGNSKLFITTFKVLQNAFLLCHSMEEKEVLAERVKFEMRHALFMEEFSLGEGYRNLLRELNAFRGIARWYYLIAKYKIKFFWIYKVLLTFKGVYRVR